MEIKFNDLTGSNKTTKGIKYKYIKGIVNIIQNDMSEITLVLSWISVNTPQRPVFVENFDCIHKSNLLPSALSNKLFDTYIIYDNSIGYYRLKCFYTEDEQERANLIRVTGKFPYSFNKEYEAQKLMNLFKNQKICDVSYVDEVDKELSNYLTHTFGIEFETASGIIPEDRCFVDGLIPLHDGSITGNEYSTIIMDHTFGLALLKQQLIDLTKYTFFNKECALHIHMGGFPVEKLSLCILYLLCYNFESSYYEGLLPRFSFNTECYKISGKSYCKKQPKFVSFEDLYSYFAEMPFFGDLYSSHPCDPDRISKWKVVGRYYALNLINMLCYQGPKTVEFRFLRPTFNYRKIRFWIMTFNAILLYTEKLSKLYKNSLISVTTGSQNTMKIASELINSQNSGFPTLMTIINNIYEKDSIIAKQWHSDYEALTYVIYNQNAINDSIGENIYLENLIMKDII